MGGSDATLLRQAAVSYAYVALWVALSSGVIVFNKYILHTYGFPFPVSLTMWHQLFCSALAVTAVHVLRIVEPIGASPARPRPATHRVVQPVAAGAPRAHAAPAV